jgi:hypothetical protein
MLGSLPHCGRALPIGAAGMYGRTTSMAKSSAEYHQTAETINHWLDTVDLDDSNELDLEDDAEALANLNVLAWSGAPESDISRAVAQARDNGCGWAPIALVLGIPRQQARHQFSALR